MNKLPGLFGIPYDVGCRVSTSQALDSRNAPRAIREQLQEILAHFHIDVPLVDRGDLTAEATVDGVLAAVQQKSRELALKDEKFCFVGGAHTLTLGTLRGLKEAGKEFSLLYFDAHPDLMPRDEIDYGSTLFHAIKEGLVDPKRMALLGVRQIEQEEKKIIDQYGIFSLAPVDLETLHHSEVLAKIQQICPAPYFMSIDLDSIDPSFAPGVSTPYPLGITPRELLAMAGEFMTPDLIGFELVELAPNLDRAGMTVSLAVALLIELHQRWQAASS